VSTPTQTINPAKGLNVPFRKMWAEKSGFGFELPSVVPNVPKKEDQLEANKAA
jgi:hypothetical protein